MKKKILVIFVCLFLVSIPVFSVVGIINDVKKTNSIKSIIRDEYVEPKLNQLYRYNSDSDWDYWSNPPHLYAISNGNVGIGTSNPSAKIDIEVSGGGAATIGSLHNIASGNFAIAIGYVSNAIGNYSTTMC